MSQMRIDYAQVAPGAIEGMLSSNTYFDRASVQQRLRRLVELRVSQINGCAYCIWLHDRQARALGESDARLSALRLWESADCFDEAERAALHWTEVVTQISDGAPTDALLEKVRSHFDDRAIVDLTGIIANMNALNRMAISFGHEPPST